MQLLVLTTLLAVALAAPMQQSLSVKDDGSYQFYYETGKEAGSHSRSEVRHPDGVVIGKFSYEDPNGDIREVSYRADDSGYVANGDVGVEGAPKGQFPAAPEDVKALPALAEGKDLQDPEPESQSSPVDSPEKSHHEDNHKAEDDMRDLSLEEATVNDPPEGFPQGFFLQHFQGLRRLPEPTAEEVTTTTQQPPVEEDKKESTPPSNVQPKEQQDGAAVQEEANKNLESGMKLFPYLQPFQNFAPQPIDSAMFHQPVYVFSYHNPDSYGYHYYF